MILRVSSKPSTCFYVSDNANHESLLRTASRYPPSPSTSPIRPAAPQEDSTAETNSAEHGRRPCGGTSTLSLLQSTGCSARPGRARPAPRPSTHPSGAQSRAVLSRETDTKPPSGKRPRVRPRTSCPCPSREQRSRNVPPSPAMAAAPD